MLHLFVCLLCARVLKCMYARFVCLFCARGLKCMYERFVCLFCARVRVNHKVNVLCWVMHTCVTSLWWGAMYFCRNG